MHEVYLRNNFKATGFLTFLKLSKQQDLCVLYYKWTCHYIFPG